MTTKLSQHITRRINVSLVVALAVAWIVQTPATSAATSAPVSGSRDLLVSNLSPSRSVNANPSRDKWTNQPAEEYHAVTGQGQSVNHAQPITHVGDTAVKVQKPQQPAVTPYKTPIGRTSLAQSSPPSVTVMLLFNRQTAVNGTVVTGTMLMYGGYQSGTLYVYWYLPTGLTYVGNSASHTYTSTTTSYNSTARKLTFTYPGGYTTGQVITATWRMSLSVSAVPVNLTVSGSASPAACCVISPALLQVQAPDNTPHSITPGGGSVALTSRMTLDFPPGAVDSDVQVTGTEYALISTTTSGAPPSAVLKLELHPALSFNAPVTLSITVTDPAMRQLLMDQSWPGLQFVDKVSHQTEVVPLTYDPVSGRLIAQLTHFSDYEVNWKPAEPQPWKLAAHGGQVGTFRGSLNYAYPIKVPAVPGSTQPNLGIGYSSVAADSGVDESRNSYAGWSLGSASPGWTLDLPKITRLVRMRQAESYGSMQVQPGQWLVDARGNLYTTGGQFIAEPNGSNTLDAYCPGPDPCDFQGWFVEAMHEYRNEFTLDMAGVSYSLIPVNDAYTEYLTEPYTPMRIRRCNVHSVPACETDGWQDTSVDREWWQVWTTDGIRYVLGGDAMGTRFFEGMDGGGNVDTYDPSAMSDENYAGSQSGRVPVAWFVRKVYAPPANGGGVGAEYIYTNTSNILLDTIAYGPSVTPDGTPVSGNGFFTVTFSYSGVTLDAIQVDTRSGRLRKYVLAHSSSKLASIEEQGVDAETGRLITKIGYGNIDGRTLVTSIDNNYGATWRYFYAPTVYYNAHLVMSSTTTVLGQRLQYPLAVPALVYSSASTTTYTYEGPCYDRSGESCRANTGGDWGNSNGLIGFAVVTETVEHSNTPTEQRTVHKYHTELPHTGREYETRSLGRQLNTLSLQRTEYAVFTNDGISTTALVTFVAPVSVTVWPGGEGYPNYFKHTRISYDCGMQGGVFQGLQTGLAEYDGNYITPYRRSSAAYAFDAVAWFSRPISEALYDGLGNRLSEQRYYYDEQLFGVLGDQGDLTFVQELGKSGETTRDMQFSYDALGNMLSVTTWPDYGTLGVTYANGRAGATTMAVYDGAYGFFATTVTNPVGHVEQYFYYGVNELPPLDPNRVYEQKQPFGLLQFVQGPNGASMGTRYYYDALGRLSHVLQPGDNFGHPSVLYSYRDANNNFTEGTDGWDGTTYGTDGGAYKWNGLKVRELRYDSPNNSFYFLTYYYYDGLGRLLQTRVEDDSGGYAQTVTSVDYDGLGNEIRRSVPATQQGLVGGYNSYQSPDWNTLEKTVTEYDALGRVITLTKPDGTIVSTGYFGSATVVTDALGRVKTAWSDFLGRLTGMIEPPTTGGSSTTTYEYDPENNLTRVTDAEGNITQIQYDNFALKSQMDDPDMGVWHYGYDALGRITRQDDARGTRLCFYYDAVGRIKGKLYQMNSIACPSDPGYAGYTQRYYYDEGGAAAYALGKRTSIANSDDTTAWTYDTRGRVVTETKSISGAPIPFVTAYTYNYNGSLNEVLYPDREHIFSSYNGARQPTAIQVKPVPLGAGLYQTYASGVTYTSLGQMTQLNMGSGLTTTYSYAPGTHLLQRIQVGNNLMDLQYNYDAVGNVVAITDTIGGDLSFSYDALDRLTGVSGTVSETYSYNAIGNFITKGGDIHWYSDTHKHAVTHVNGERVAWYDANGNMATRMENGTTYLQEWDAENRLTVVTDTLTGQSVRFAYDADGNRVKRMDAGGVVFYGSGIIELMVPATTTLNTSVNLPRPLNSFPWQSWPHGTRMRTYYYLGATRVAMRDTTALSTEVTFLHGDHLGSASLATSITGAKVGELRYMPFGEERTGFLGVPTDRTYTGQRRESFGLMDYGARYYSPRLGQFISADNIVLSPNDPQNLSRYSYVYNNPLRYIDPTGHNCRDPGTSEDECRTSGGGGAGVGGYWGGGTGKVSTSSSDSEAGVFERVVRFLCPACADGNNLSSPDQAKKVFDEVQRPEGSPWLLKVNERGLAVEKLLGGNLPRNFETIDRFKDGVATSIKSIDLLAPSYQNLNILKATVEGHINSVRLFKGASGRDVKITSDMITARVLSIGIPPGATQEQIKTLMELQQWAAPQGVDVIITIVK